jgi:hypothetical protein
MTTCLTDVIPDYGPRGARQNRNSLPRWQLAVVRCPPFRFALDSLPIRKIHPSI